MLRRYELFVHLNESGWRAWPGGDVEPGWREVFKHVAFEESLATVDDGGRKAGYGVRDLMWDQAVFNDAVESLVEGHVTYTRTVGRSVR